MIGEEVRRAFPEHPVFAIHIVDDLCGLAGRRDPVLHHWAAGGRLAVFACRPRAVRWLLQRAGLSLLPGQLTVINRSPEQNNKVPAINRDQYQMIAREVPAKENQAGQWIPWFPVIDYGRCVDCRQCISFCLFGVYEEGPDGRVEVARPVQCKTYCPACARVCPEGAIIFPKCPESPINGEEIENQQAFREAARRHLDELMNENTAAALLRRRKAIRLTRQRRQSAAGSAAVSGE